MSASRTKSFRINHALADAIELRAKNLGYPSGTAYLVALAQYDCLCQSAHGVTREWAQLPPIDQDDLNSRLLSRVLIGKGMRSPDAAKVNWKDL